jgi:hypothetical protein
MVVGEAKDRRVPREESSMSSIRQRGLSRSAGAAPVLSLFGLLVLAGCAGNQISLGGPTEAPPPAAAPEPLPTPPAYQPQEFVGRWGYASYQAEKDRKRTEAAARAQCRKPYVIGRGRSGGIMMHLPDQTRQSELAVKGGPGGKTYIGPGVEPAGPEDREVVSFDGRVLILKWVNPDVQSRYGIGVYVRCAPRA